MFFILIAIIVPIQILIKKGAKKNDTF